MTKKLYVGGLPYNVTDDILKNLLSAYGTVESVTVLINKITDLPDGFGFVEMSCESEAQEAIQNLNGTQVEGRTIRVYEARPRLLPLRRKSAWRHRCGSLPNKFFASGGPPHEPPLMDAGGA